MIPRPHGGGAVRGPKKAAYHFYYTTLWGSCTAHNCWQKEKSQARLTRLGLFRHRNAGIL